MDKNELEFKNLFNMDEWKRLLTSLSEAFGVSAAMVDYKGVLAFDVINCCEFCQAIMSNPVGKKRCIKSALLSGLEAMRLDKPLITYCHAGLAIGVLPVMINEKYIGSVCFGQIILEGDSARDRDASVLGERSWIRDGEMDELKDYLTELFRKIPQMKKESFYRIIEAMSCLLRYTTDRAVEFKNEKQTYEWILKNAITPLFDSANDLSASLPAKSAPSSVGIRSDNQLYPAVLYIEQHPEEAVTMHDMAELCHLSHSYFSKLWLRNMGENFTVYVNRRKTELAKELLQNSSGSISFISSSLGFSDTSYFIKVFKKIEGITPLAYRQHKYLQK